MMINLLLKILHRRRGFVSSVVVSATVFLGAFCLNAQAEDAYRFGVANDLTGPSSYHGKTFAAGFSTYLHKINSEGGVNGRTVELIQENAERNVQKEVGFVRKFAEDDKVLAAMIVTTDGLFAIKPIADSLKIPIVGLGIPELASDPPTPWLFNIFASYQDTVFAAIDYIVNTVKDKDPKIGVVYPSTQFGLEALRAAELGVQKYGKHLTSKVIMELRETDATSQMLALKNAEVKYVIVQLAAAHIAAILRDANKVGLEATFFGTTQTMDREPDLILRQPGGEQMAKHFIGVGPWSKWNEADVPGIREMRDLVKKHEKVTEDKLGEIMYSNFVQGYVTAMVLVEALRKAGPQPTGEKMRDAMEKLVNFNTNGITPPISFGPKRHKGFNDVKLFKIDPVKKVYIPLSGEWVTVK